MNINVCMPVYVYKCSLHVLLIVFFLCFSLLYSWFNYSIVSLILIGLLKLVAVLHRGIAASRVVELMQFAQRDEHTHTHLQCHTHICKCKYPNLTNARLATREREMGSDKNKQTHLTIYVRGLKFKLVFFLCALLAKRFYLHFNFAGIVLFY